jgi:hypothetical protein
MDAAWSLWQNATSNWAVATRRWPRRLEFERGGMKDEIVVRAACCLIFTTSDDSGNKIPNCPNCPLDIGDESRIRWMVDWLEQLRLQQGTPH